MSDSSAQALVVLKSFVDASMRKDVDAMRACLTRQTLESGQFHGESPEGVEFILGEPASEGDNVVIPLRAVPQGSPADAPAVMEMSCIMTPEDGAWKLDLGATIDRMMGRSVESVVGQMADAMGQAMGAMGDAISQGLSQAFGPDADDGASQDWSHATLELADEELLPLPDLTPLPQTAAAVSQAIGSPVIVQAAISDLLKQVASDQADVLINWFETQLFSEWGQLFQWAADQSPARHRLRAVRIEAASSHEERFLALDGSDLVYRMFINDDRGYYTSAQIAQVLPGILAGLPQSIDPRAADRRLLPGDDESPDLELYRNRIIPRYMRLIGQRLGRNISLQVNWDEVYDEKLTARKLWVWGLNRVHGGIALACQDPDFCRELAEELTTIRITLGYDVSRRYARHDPGILDIGLCHYAGERGCFYEADIARVLHGESIEYQDEPSEPSNATDESAGSSPSEEPTADSLNDEHFAQAIASLREVEPSWRQQLEIALGHPVDLFIDFDSLDGRFERVQPFVHQAISGALGAISQIAYDPARHHILSTAQRVVIQSVPDARECGAFLSDAQLTLWAPLDQEGAPPVDALAAAISFAAEAEPPPAPAPDEDAYATAQHIVDQLQAALQDASLWPGDPPAEGFEIRGAFGCESLSFPQWLAWVLISRIRAIIAGHGTFPTSSQVSAYAVRELDGIPGGDQIVSVLSQLDEFVESLAQ